MYFILFEAVGKDVISLISEKYLKHSKLLVIKEFI